MLRSVSCRFVIASLVLACQVARATPLKDDTSTGPIKWNVPVTVYISQDPEPGRSRQDKVKQAVDQWVATAQASGVAVNTVQLDANGNIPGTGNKPNPNTPGTVTVDWTDVEEGNAASQWTGTPTGRKTQDGKDILRNQTFVSVKIELHKGTTALPGVDNQKALTTGMHEMGHALGLDHSNETDSIMRPTSEEYIDKTTIGDSDKREVRSVYVASSVTPQSSYLQITPGWFRYTYTATWQSGGELALVQVVTSGAPIYNPQTPAGWELCDYPYSGMPNIVAFRIAPTDTLQAYLNEANPTATFTFDSPWAPGTSIGWMGDDYDVTAPVPEPSSLLVLIGGLGSLLALKRRR